LNAINESLPNIFFNFANKIDSVCLKECAEATGEAVKEHTSRKRKLHKRLRK